VGETTFDPFTATEAPFRVALVALVDDQVSVELPPELIDVGFAEMLAVGAPGEVTVTVTWPESVAPVELVPVILYAVVTVGETTIDPLRATGVPLRVALTQLMVFQVSVVLLPEVIVAGSALIPAAGACAHAGQQSRPVTPMSQKNDPSRTRTRWRSNSTLHPSRS
jgi:hypothetical protein